jgi:hypothetical protein
VVPTLAEIQRRWPQIVSRVQSLAPGSAVYLLSGKPVALEGNTVMIETASSFVREGLKNPNNRAAVAAALSGVLGAQVTVSALAGEAAPTQTPVHTAAAPAPSHPVAGQAVAGQAAAQALSGAPDWVEDEPLVKSAMKLFRARIIETKRPPAQNR